MDELERLQRALDAVDRKAREEAREAALNAALSAFDARADDSRQGKGLVARLRKAALAASEIFTGRRPMTSISMRQALAGGASLAVLALAALTAANLQNIEGFLQRGPGDIVFAPPSDEPALRDAGKSLPMSAPGTLADQETRPAPPPPPTLPASPEPMPAPEVATADQLQGLAGGAAPVARPFVGRREMGELAAGSAAAGKVAATAPAMEAFAPSEPVPQPGYHDQGRDRFDTIDTNPVKLATEDPVSTFSIDVDTASYAFTRADLESGVLPPDDAVRVEELINYFPYDYPGPATAETPFEATATIMPTPWNTGTKLLAIGIKGYDLTPATRPKANLVFLIDTSGSMEEPNKLPLLINALKMLVGELAPEDEVAIVTYAGSAGTVLEPTPASDSRKIIAALDNLRAGGSTAGAEGIRQAYQLAERGFDKGGVNRVILATDGDFNVGITSNDELQSFVERERDSGIFLSVIGFGRGNYNDSLMQALAQNGNGTASYIDTLSEARKVLVEEATSTLFPIAKDVKLQVEFNPATVSEYRLIGYESRLLNREDFNNDKVDAGDIGSGHTVTALYEITPAGGGARLVDDLRYKADAPKPGDAAAAGTSDEYAFLKIRYKLPDEDTSKLIETPVTKANEIGPAGGGETGREARFAASVAAFGQILRGGRYTGDFSYDDVIALANANKGEDPFGYRSEFVNMVRLAKSAASMERLQQP